MSILKALTESSSVSQERLARLAGIVPSMVNKYIKDFE
ncbi:MAG TPA: winged helix-turn-helix domain-containing protein, partial [Mesotoga sp.]|nr:winged helix-turn-helix domain-containing protein [Mesotoga sp.]HQQ57567.1 winged helix-turn-helix domain-containing protein [Mesotoga sp.]